MCLILAYALSLFVAIVHAAQLPVDTPPIAPSSSVALIELEGEIGPNLSRYFKRALQDALDAKFGTIILHITSDGGSVIDADQIANALLALPASGPHVYAFIDDRAWSGGAFIAYATERIYMTDRAKIGDIGVITHSADGHIEYLPEKINTAFRTMLRNIAQKRGWPMAKLVKMTALNQDLYRLTTPHGLVFIIEDDLPRYLAEHPDVDGTKKVLIAGHDRLLSYTAREAVADGMATALVADLPDLYATLGIHADQVKTIKPNDGERFSWVLAGWAPLLAACAVFFLILEFKTPGVMIWLVLAGICGAAFFVCQYYQDLAGSLEIILVLSGLACLIIEFFVFHTSGLLLLLGLCLGLSGLVLSFMPDATQFHPDAPSWGRELTTALINSVMCLLTIAAGMVVIITSIPKLRALRRFTVTAQIDASTGGQVDAASQGAGSAAQTMIGKIAVAQSELRPSGFVTLGDLQLSASSEHGEFIAAGAHVRVVAISHGEVMVRTLHAGEASPAGALA